jgi:hypothetical protein
MLMMDDVQWKASEAVRTVVSTASLMTLLASDHFEFRFSKVLIFIQYQKLEQNLWCLRETSDHQHEKPTVDLANLLLRYFDLNLTGLVWDLPHFVSVTCLILLTVTSHE